MSLSFRAFRAANVARCLKWHPAGIESWSSSDWLTAVTGELGELASLIKMRNRERDGLVGNKFSPTQQQIADEIADVLTYLDLLAAVLGVDLGRAAADKFNQVSERVGFPDRINSGEGAYTYAVVIKHPGRDWESDVRVDLIQSPHELSPAKVREWVEAKMLGPFQVLFVTQKVNCSRSDAPIAELAPAAWSPQ